MGGAYSGRQERPYRREFDELEDMPEVFIPSELTGNQIERAFRMAGTKQAVPEINELLKYLEFTATREGEPWLLLEDGHFKPTENCINQLKDLLSTEDLFNGVDEKMKETMVVMSEELKLKEQYEDWDDLSAEINRIFKGITGKLLEGGYIKLNEDGFYTLTKTVTDLVKMTVKEKVLEEQRQWRVRDEANFNEVREFEDWEDNISSPFCLFFSSSLFLSSSSLLLFASSSIFILSVAIFCFSKRSFSLASFPSFSFSNRSSSSL